MIAQKGNNTKQTIQLESLHVRTRYLLNWLRRANQHQKVNRDKCPVSFLKLIIESSVGDPHFLKAHLRESDTGNQLIAKLTLKIQNKVKTSIPLKTI